MFWEAFLADIGELPAFYRQPLIRTTEAACQVLELPCSKRDVGRMVSYEHRRFHMNTGRLTIICLSWKDFPGVGRTVTLSMPTISDGVE